MDEIVDDAMRQPRISMVLIAGFAVGALLLVAMGLFGMVSGAVSQRRGEMAVRLALGATHDRVLRLVFGEGALLVSIGMLIAGPGVYVAGKLLRGVLIGVSPLDCCASSARGVDPGCAAAPPLYWSRSTSMGSTRAARIAGTADATADTAASKPTTNVNVSGSAAATP